MRYLQEIHQKTQNFQLTLMCLNIKAMVYRLLLINFTVDHQTSGLDASNFETGTVMNGVISQWFRLGFVLKNTLSQSRPLFCRPQSLFKADNRIKKPTTTTTTTKK
jgi:hypothetical protein